MFFQALQSYVTNLKSEFQKIPEKRKETLEILGDYILTSIRERNVAELLFICTHNSRRSQLGQIWAHTASLYHGIENIHPYSGGTETTNFDTRAVAAVERAGFGVQKTGGGDENPKYIIKASASEAGNTMYSKKYNDPSNPSTGFCAIMVCSDADETCPHIPGAEMRISIPYSDPKEFDGKELEQVKYDERCRQISVEMFYLFRYVSNKS